MQLAGRNDADVHVPRRRMHGADCDAVPVLGPVRSEDGERIAVPAADEGRQRAFDGRLRCLGCALQHYFAMVAVLM
jgi:hypothetical protein